MHPPEPDQMVAAVAALERGDCIGLPTETVYGLAADAHNPAAVRRIFELKGRPADHPLILHLPSAQALDGYVRAVPAHARKLAENFWPGPLTLILPRGPNVPDVVTGGQPTVGVRVPAHPLAANLLHRFGRAVAAPSANRFGRISPTRAEHVRAEFGAAVPIVLDGGPCEVGIESTIVDCSGAQPRILRPGMLGAAAIEAVTGPLAQADASAPKVSGTLEKHYAPRAPLRLVPREALSANGQPFRALALNTLPGGVQGVALPADPAAYARRLYAVLRMLDGDDGSEIRVEQPPMAPAWTAVWDRLRRAAAGSGGG